MPTPVLNNATSVRPPITLLLGASGSGKTAHVVRTFLEEPATSLLVVSSAEQAHTRICEIAALSGRPDADFDGKIIAFHTLVSVLVSASGEADARRIGQPLKRMALADIVQRSIKANDFLGRMRDAPGFVPALAERIREWKLARLTPDALERGGAEAAERLGDPTLAMKSRELARIFRAYSQFLDVNRLRDEEDCLADATRTAHSSYAGARYFAVDGMYRFNRLERALISAFASRIGEDGAPPCHVTVTLPYDAERPLLFAAPERTRAILRAEFTVSEQTATPEQQRVDAIACLGAALFSDAVPVSCDEPCDSIALIDAPNAYVEAELVAREFRRLHDTGGYAWRDLAVILRVPADYSAILAAVFERYQIPATLDAQVRLADMAPLRTILALFEIVTGGWQREAVLRFLKSSFTAPDRLAADALRRTASRRGVRAGADRWLALSSSDDHGPLSATLRLIAKFDRRLREECARPADFVDAVHDIDMQFGITERCGQIEPDRAEAERAAIRQGLQALDDFVRMAGIAHRDTITLEEFQIEMRRAWEALAASSEAAPGDRVFVTEPYYARKRLVRAAAVMGLTERMFPRRITEDPFLRDAERAALLDATGIALDEQRFRSDDERLFFYLAVTAPTERLLLSYPRSSQNSDTLPSFYLDEVRSAFLRMAPSTESTGLTVISRTLADVAPRPAEVVSPGDGLLAACTELTEPLDGRDGRSAEQRLNSAEALLVAAEVGGLPAAAVMAVLRSRRLPPLPALVDESLRAEFAGGNRVFSVSELETYRRCPFQYLLRHALRLRDEQDGVSPGAQGTLLHAALCRVFRDRKARGIDTTAVPPGPAESAEADEALTRDLHAALDAALDERPMDASPHRVSMAKRLLSESLTAFAGRENRFTPRFGFAPAHFELAFGFQDASVDLLEDDDRDAAPAGDGSDRPQYDPASLPAPLLLFSGESCVRVCGSIDRVDRHAESGVVLALDYKLGSSPEFSDMSKGASLQMPLYMLALERLFGKVAAVGCYDAMREKGRRRLVRSTHTNPQPFQPVIGVEDGRTVTCLNADQYANLVLTAEATAVSAAQSIAKGRIEATPGRPCGMCPYGDVCRTTETGGHDGERPGATETMA